MNISGLQAGDVELTITNLLGQLVIETKEMSGNGQVAISGVNSFKAGIYHVTILQNEQSTSKKIVIK
ncbi:hypothetical protein BST97_05145 [Nonlabens spongiae]|uniref:Secretion system C-terminal sorting domain-containing protein n=1 Tax=Nonlabens spongiae TaxID=331648 RepID=A0A1W6MIH8_9FLAO|nr:hypothetical protein BST97_05145 [Nonlabens spongiae]